MANERQLIGRIRNGLRALSRTRRDNRQAQLVTDLAATLRLLEIEVLKTNDRRSEMRRSGTGSGGGIGMNKNVQPPIRTGAGAKAAHLGGVSQLGNKVGNHITNKSATGFRGDPLFAGPGYNPSRYGNEIAKNVGVGGPGKGREVTSCGSQGTHGAPAPGNPPPSGELFPGWPASKR